MGGGVPDDAEVTVRLLLSDESAVHLPDADRLEPVVVATIGHLEGPLQSVPASA